MRQRFYAGPLMIRSSSLSALMRRLPLAERRARLPVNEPIEGLCALVIEGAVRTALENLFDVQRDLRSTWQPIYFPVALVKKDGHVYRLVSPDETSLGESSLAVSKAALNEFIRLHKPSEPSRQAGTSSQDVHPPSCRVMVSPRHRYCWRSHRPRDPHQPPCPRLRVCPRASSGVNPGDHMRLVAVARRRATQAPHKTAPYESSPIPGGGCVRVPGPSTIQ